MKKVIVSLLLGGLLLAGCSSSKEYIGLDKAQTYALKEYDGKVVKAQEELDEHNPYYEISIVNEDTKYELEVDAISGNVILTEQEKITIDDTSNTTPPANNDTNQGDSSDLITMEQAQQIALDRVGSGTVTKNELDYEEDTNSYQYDVEIRAGNVEYEIEIDAKTGEITKYNEDIED